MQWNGAKRRGRFGRFYGQFYVGGGREGAQYMGAHRFAWELATGDQLSYGHTILQTCGNTLCVNYEHLKMVPPWWAVSQ